MLLKEQWKECVKPNYVLYCYSRLQQQFLDDSEFWDPPCWTTCNQCLRLQKHMCGKTFPWREHPSQYCGNSVQALQRQESSLCFCWHSCVISASYALQHPYQFLVLLHQPCSEKAAGLETRRWGRKVGRKSCWFSGEEVKEEKRCHGRTGKGSELPRSAQ